MNELDFARNESAKLHDNIHELTEERDELRATIERMERQVPIAYYWMNLEKSKPEMGASPSERWLSWPLYGFPGAQEQPVQGVPKCPYPCGWQNLLKHAIEDGAYLARSINEDEPVTENARSVTMRMVMRLRDVLMAINKASPGGKP